MKAFTSILCALLLPLVFCSAVFINSYRFPQSGGDPDFASVVLLLHCDGSNGSTTFTDSSSKARTMTASGAAQVDTAISQFGGGSINLAASASNYMDSSGSADFYLNADFTIELWYYPEATPNVQAVLDIGGYVSGISLRTNQTGNAFSIWIKNTVYNRSYTWTLNTWHYIAVKRSGSTISMWVNGVQVGSSITDGSALTASTPTLRIGHILAGGVFYQNRHLDEIRITNGVARDVSTVPTAAFPDS